MTTIIISSSSINKYKTCYSYNNVLAVITAMIIIVVVVGGVVVVYKSI